MLVVIKSENYGKYILIYEFIYGIRIREAWEGGIRGVEWNSDKIIALALCEEAVKKSDREEWKIRNKAKKMNITLIIIQHTQIILIILMHFSKDS